MAIISYMYFSIFVLAAKKTDRPQIKVQQLHFSLTWNNSKQRGRQVSVKLDTEYINEHMSVNNPMN